MQAKHRERQLSSLLTLAWWFRKLSFLCELFLSPSLQSRSPNSRHQLQMNRERAFRAEAGGMPVNNSLTKL